MKTSCRRGDGMDLTVNHLNQLQQFQTRQFVQSGLVYYKSISLDKSDRPEPIRRVTRRITQCTFESSSCLSSCVCHFLLRRFLVHCGSAPK